jgi:hypothetical protein
MAEDSITTTPEACALVNRAMEAGWVTLANTYIDADPYKG